MQGRAQRAMQLLILAEVRGMCTGREREACVAAARAVLCDEFNDVRLYWKVTGWFLTAPKEDDRLWELVAAGPGGDFDRVSWRDAGGGQ